MKCLGAAFAVLMLPVHAAEPVLPVLPVDRLREELAEKGRVVSSFRLEGVVCDVSPSRRLLAFQDASGTSMLELPPVAGDIAAGSQVVIACTDCTVSRGRFGIELGTAPVAEFDLRHSAMSRSGVVHLAAGPQSFRVEWFNWAAGAVLELEVEGPGIPRQKVPSAWFRHRDPAGEWRPGLRYRVYSGGGWTKLPDFQSLEAAADGETADLDIKVRKREQDVGMTFTGFLDVPATGVYSFRLTSDDGSRLFVGDPRVTCSLSRDGDPRRQVETRPARDLSVAPSRGEWANVEGDVAFAALDGGQLQLDLSGRDSSWSVRVMEPGDWTPAGLIGRRVEVRGIGLPEGIVCLSGRGLEIIGETEDREEVLVLVEQVRHLQPAEAAKPYRARLRGVVTTVTPTAVVMQDRTGGVYVDYSTQDSANRPRSGELWEIEGNTDPGQFSPMIFADRGTYLGSAEMPEAARPTGEQLASGSLDAELVEIEGVVVSCTGTEMVLLTRGGRLRIDATTYMPLPYHEWDDASRAALPGSVVRVRGVFIASWDAGTGRVNAGICKLADAIITVDEPTPRDPFAAASMKASDLLLFTSHPGAFKRVKVSGVLLHARPPEYFLCEGREGFRIVSRNAAGLLPGDRVEAAGFPRLAGPSPVLMEASARKVEGGKLPAPEAVDAGRLPDTRLDSTRVVVDATLLSDSMREEERVLEVQAGDHRFVARLAEPAPGLKTLERGSLLSLTGTYASAPSDHPAGASDPFEILLASPSDIVVLKRGPWWTLRHTIISIAALSGGLLAALVWVLLLRRRVSQRTRELAGEIEERQTAERHRAMEQERTRVANDLHDELGSGITEAGILASLVKNPAVPQDRKADYLEQLSEVCKTMVTGLDEIVWAVNPRYDSAVDLAGYFSLVAQRFLGLAGINCRFNIDESVADHPLDSRQRHSLFLAFREALNNIVRHSKAGEVVLSITMAGDELRVSLNDDGGGFDRAVTLPGSDGLTGMEERLQELGGVCRIIPDPGRGTTVEFSLPLAAKTA